MRVTESLWKIYEPVHFIVVGIFYWLVFLPVILLPCAVFFGCCKVCVLLAAFVFKRDLIPISFNDAFFAVYSCEEEPLMSVGTTFRLKGRVSTLQLMHRWRDCFLREEDSSKYLNLYCYFVKYGGFLFKRRVKEIVLCNHFVETTLDEDADPEEYISKWLVKNTFKRKPCGEGQPPWQLLIIRRPSVKVAREEETIICFKMHHGMCDGYSLVHMIDKLTGENSPYMVQKTQKECLLTWFKHILECTSLTYDVFIRIIRTPDLFKQGDPFESDWIMSLSTLDDELQTVKSIRKRTNAKFSNIVMTAMTGALKKMYMEEKGKTLDELPEQIFFESPIALPNHPSMTKGGKFCNHFTAGIYASNLHTDDKLHRLRALEKDFHSFQEHGGMRLMSWILFGYYWLHPTAMRRIYTNYMSFLWRFSILYSGMMTSPTKVSLVGHPVENIYFLQGTASSFPYVSLYIMCSTYAGKMDVSLYAAKSVVKTKPELERLVQKYLKEELREMSRLLDMQQDKDRSVLIDIDQDGGKGNFLRYWFCQTTM